MTHTIRHYFNQRPIPLSNSAQQLQVLAEHKESCKSCNNYAVQNPYLAHCKLKGKVVQEYNICEFHGKVRL